MDALMANYGTEDEEDQIIDDQEKVAIGKISAQVVSMLFMACVDFLCDAWIPMARR